MKVNEVIREENIANDTLVVLLFATGLLVVSIRFLLRWTWKGLKFCFDLLLSIGRGIRAM